MIDSLISQFVLTFFFGFWQLPRTLWFRSCTIYRITPPWKTWEPECSVSCFRHWRVSIVLVLRFPPFFSVLTWCVLASAPTGSPSGRRNSSSDWAVWVSRCPPGKSGWKWWLPLDRALCGEGASSSARTRDAHWPFHGCTSTRRSWKLSIKVFLLHAY